jgi:hypothetical protein
MTARPESNISGLQVQRLPAIREQKINLAATLTKRSILQISSNRPATTGYAKTTFKEPHFSWVCQCVFGFRCIIGRGNALEMMTVHAGQRERRLICRGSHIEDPRKHAGALALI